MSILEYMYLSVIFILVIRVLWVGDGMEYMFRVWYYNCYMVILSG